jgi:nitroimidazol reductase NimA-like FMN-containing flavoprotein (pyridoxamine 5'-phosphate oxidase superfamily)
MLVRALTVGECTKLVAANRLARLASAKDGQPYVVPIHYAYADNCLYAFSMPGRKIDNMRSNPRVSILVEEHGTNREWKSVVVEGHYEELPDRVGHKRMREHAWSLLSKHVNWWEPGALKPMTLPLSDHADHLFFRVVVDGMSGREAIMAS